MAAVLTRRAYLLTIGFIVAFSFSLFAQSRPTVVAPGARNLSSTLGDLSRVAPATIQDLDIAGQHGKLHWVAFWRGDKATAETMEALRRNLEVALPNLVHDAQVSGGSISTTFKLYRDLTAVCHSMESLFPRGSESKPELAALNTDFADLNRLKEELSSYIERTAASHESRNPQLYTSAAPSGGVPKRIIDDTVPESSSAKKRKASTP
jgi:hypothetical protein